MISERWAELVSALADRGIPLYAVTDPIDNANVPSWAVLAAVGMVLVAALVFVVFPMAKVGLTVTTTPGAKVVVAYGEARLSKTATDGTAQFQVPLGSTVNVKITKENCTGESLDVLMLDQYAFEKALACP